MTYFTSHILTAVFVNIAFNKEECSFIKNLYMLKGHTKLVNEFTSKSSNVRLEGW